MRYRAIYEQIRRTPFDADNIEEANKIGEAMIPNGMQFADLEPFCEDCQHWAMYLNAYDGRKCKCTSKKWKI